MGNLCTVFNDCDNSTINVIDEYTDSATYQMLSGVQNAYIENPLQGEDKNTLLVFHKETIESSSNTLLSCIETTTGKKKWTIDTGATAIYGYNLIDKNNILVCCNNDSGSTGWNSNTNYMLSVSLDTGAYTGYDFKYNRFFN